MIDTTFDVRVDARGGDPDRTSPTLRRYHKLLWSKPLPSGSQFLLNDSTPGVYLHHRSDLGEFFLTSDSITHTYSRWSSTAHIIERLPQAEREAFMYLGYTIGGFIVFPGNLIDRKPTINGARGMHPKIRDRFDLTLECIRRHYRGQPSPLSETLERYSSFFRLFDDFQGYVDFFLLRDLVQEDGLGVKFWPPFDDFASSPVPRTLEQYLDYRSAVIAFAEARNRRMREYCKAHDL